jgi:hypothetical protein
MLIRSTARRWRIQRVTRRVSFAPSSAHGREVWKIFLAQAGLAQVKRGTRTCRRVGNPDVQAGGEPHDRQINESTSDVVPLHPGHRAVRAGVGYVHRVGVDDGESSCVGGIGDRQTEFCGAADGIGDEIASRVHSRVLVRSDEGFETLILYRLGPLYVVPPRILITAQLRTPKREEPPKAGDSIESRYNRR